MKKLVVMLFVAVVAIMISSCQQEEDIFNRKFVSDPPEALEENRFQAYVDFESLQSIKFLGNYGITNRDEYVDNNGVNVVSYYTTQTDYYSIKARKYWNWYFNFQYVSNYTEEYQISSSTLNQIRDKLKNTEYIIVHKRTVAGEDDPFGLGLLIWGVD